MSRGLARVIGPAVGLGLLSLWWANHGEEVHALVLSRLGWLLGGLIAATAAMILQWVRTAWLLRVERPASLIPTVLLAHGLNVFLPSLLGDAYEVGAVSTLTGRPVSRVLTRLLSITNRRRVPECDDAEWHNSRKYFIWRGCIIRGGKAGC